MILAPTECQRALEAVRTHGHNVFSPDEDWLRRELTGALEAVLFGH